jgi:hypothetical protein
MAVRLLLQVLFGVLWTIFTHGKEGINLFKARTITVWIFLLISLFFVPAQGSAAYMELSATAKRNLDATATQAGGAAAARIHSLYTQFLSSEKEEKELDQRIKTLHDANSKSETELLFTIRQLDASKLQQLEFQVQQVKQKHQPLFDRYTALNKQLATAKSLKNSTLTFLLNLQAQAMKVLVQAARHEVRVKEDALRSAKTTANQKIKKHREALDAMKPLDNKIKLLKQSIASNNKQMTPTWSNLNAQLKKRDSTEVEIALTTLLHLSKQTVVHKREIVQLEQQIASIIRDVEKRTNSST